mgnify:CR=1 FL=1
MQTLLIAKNEVKMKEKAQEANKIWYFDKDLSLNFQSNKPQKSISNNFLK